MYISTNIIRNLTAAMLGLVTLLLGEGAYADGFSIESKIDNGQRAIILHNETSSPLSVKLSLPNSKNLASNQHWPIVTSIQAHAQNKIAMLYAKNPTLSYSYSLKSEYIQGDFRASPDTEMLYRLPFKDGLAFYISQAADGIKTTHTHSDSFYAIDFTMPEGTPIVASRDGIVIKAESSFRDGGNKPELISQANIVKILHDDGSIAGYAHLRFGGTTVQVGDHVKAGDLIGFSGSTGYSTGPHLHFAVIRVAYENGKFVEKSIPVKLYTGKPALTFTPSMGMLAVANYQTSASMPIIKKTTEKKTDQLAWQPSYWLFIFIPAMLLIVMLYMRVKVEKQHYHKLMDEINQEYDQYKS